MEAKRLMKVTYQDLKKGIRLNAYADAVIWSEDPSPTLAGLRFGGYAEVVRGLTDAIYGGATIEIEDADGSLLTLKSLSKQYHREVSHEGLYAEATLIAEDEIQESSKSQDEKSSKHAQKDDLFDDNVPQQDIPAHICYIFCHPGPEILCAHDPGISGLCSRGTKAAQNPPPSQGALFVSGVGGMEALL